MGLLNPPNGMIFPHANYFVTKIIRNKNEVNYLRLAKPSSMFYSTGLPNMLALCFLWHLICALLKTLCFYKSCLT
jgi:hypothetical protein